MSHPSNQFKSGRGHEFLYFLFYTIARNVNELGIHGVSWTIHAVSISFCHPLDCHNCRASDGGFAPRVLVYVTTNCQVTGSRHNTTLFDSPEATYRHNRFLNCIVRSSVRSDSLFDFYTPLRVTQYRRNLATPRVDRSLIFLFALGAQTTAVVRAVVIAADRSDVREQSMQQLLLKIAL